jgi:hypothetical protein
MVNSATWSSPDNDKGDGRIYWESGMKILKLLIRTWKILWNWEVCCLWTGNRRCWRIWMSVKLIYLCT